MAALMIAERRKGRTKAERHRQKYWYDNGDAGKERHLMECDGCMSWRNDIINQRRIHEWREAQRIAFDAKRAIQGWKRRS